MAEPLLIDEITCICIDNLSLSEIVQKIKKYNEPEAYAQMCKNAYENFQKVVDFDKEAELIKQFLSKLL